MTGLQDFLGPRWGHYPGSPAHHARAQASSDGPSDLAWTSDFACRFKRVGAPWDGCSQTSAQADPLIGVVRTADGLLGTLADLQSPVCPMTHHTHETKIEPSCRRSGSRPGAERRLT